MLPATRLVFVGVLLLPLILCAGSSQDQMMQESREVDAVVHLARVMVNGQEVGSGGSLFVHLSRWMALGTCRVEPSGDEPVRVSLGARVAVAFTAAGSFDPGEELSVIIVVDDTRRFRVDKWRPCGVNGCQWNVMLLPEHELASAGARTIDVRLYLGNCDGGVCEDASPIAMDSVQILVSVSVKTEGGNDYFGSMFEHIHAAGAGGGSEFGLGALLFSTALSVRAKTIVEIGRWKGLSAVSLGSALRYQDERPWKEHNDNRQRKEVDYSEFEAPQERRIVSIDPMALKEAQDRLTAAGLIKYFRFIERFSQHVDLVEEGLVGIVDLVFVDGDHSYHAALHDILHYRDALRPNGIMMVHDMFGWYNESGQSDSPVRRAVEEVVAIGGWERTIVDTGYQSVAIMRKIESADPVKYDEIIDRVWPQGEPKLTPEKWAAAKRDSEL